MFYSQSNLTSLKIFWDTYAKQEGGKVTEYDFPRNYIQLTFWDHNVRIPAYFPIPLGIAVVFWL